MSSKKKNGKHVFANECSYRFIASGQIPEPIQRNVTSVDIAMERDVRRSQCERVQKPHDQNERVANVGSRP